MYRDEEIEEEYKREIEDKRRQVESTRFPQLQDYEDGTGGLSYWGRLKDHIQLIEDESGPEGS